MLELKKGGSTGNLTAAEKEDLEEEYKAQLEENEREMAEMKKSFEDKLAQVQKKGEDTETVSFSKTFITVSGRLVTDKWLLSFVCTRLWRRL